jgi:hypothetical protein
VTPTLPIDIRVPGVGRIHRRSGVTKPRDRNRIVAMLQELPKLGFRELACDVQRGRRAALAVYAHYTAGTLPQLVGPTDDQPLGPLANAWLDGATCAEGTRDNRRDAFRALRKLGSGTLLLRDLPELLQRYREQCETAAHPRTFNIARTAVQAFLRDKMGKRRPLALVVADVPPLKEVQRGAEGLPLAEAIEIRDALGAVPGRIWWSMCLTGMGPKELWGRWSVEQDRVHVEGTKTSGRRRGVPLVDYPVRPEMTRDGFVSALRRLSAKRETHVTPYQARKTHARWMEDAHIPRARREVYRGHGKRDIGDLYERYEIAAFLQDDAQRMRALLGGQKLQVMPGGKK